jgi:23S rRNA pseudouridine1911/1915/1917 synthase
MSIPIIYEDDWLVIVDKPAGLLTIPAPKKNLRTLTDILNEDLKSKGLSYRLHPCHRLDRETSGLIIYAKGKSVQKKMMDLFKNQRINKTYIAFVQGKINEDRGQINKPIDGISALTSFRVLERRKNFTIVELNPKTGRKNQIRIHFKSIGHPLVGETKFAFRKDYRLRAKRLCLHAKSLEFTHPVTGKLIRKESKLAAELEKFLQINKD